MRLFIVCAFAALTIACSAAGPSVDPSPGVGGGSSSSASSSSGTGGATGCEPGLRCKAVLYAAEVDAGPIATAAKLCEFQRDTWERLVFCGCDASSPCASSCTSWCTGLLISTWELLPVCAKCLEQAEPSGCGKYLDACLTSTGP